MKKILLGLMILGGTMAAHAMECTKDSQCGADQYCDKGECLSSACGGEPFKACPKDLKCSLTPSEIKKGMMGFCEKPTPEKK